jgi:glyoxylase-like metal-dependent hydrolase (beta-lactamase superfamily II)
MPAFICRACGVQATAADLPPDRCPICDDERQYVGWGGQRWTTQEEMTAESRRNELREEETGLVSIGTRPSFAIGQRALLVRTPAGNVLWDCISYLDAETVAEVRRLGGVQAIALSHPHFYGNMVDWSDAFSCPIYVHEADSAWVQRTSSALSLWQGVSHEILPGVTLLNPGGHFDGAAVLYWARGADGRGALLSGDTVTVVQDRRYVSFMYSYPNLIPLSAPAIERIVDTLRPYDYQRIYGAWDGRVVALDGARSVERSAERYLRMLRGA